MRKFKIKKRIRIVSGIFALISIVCTVLFFFLQQSDYIELKTSEKSALKLSKGDYILYLVNDNANEIQKRNYYFELKDLKNNIIRKFPDTAVPKFIFEVETVGNKIYTSYANFAVDETGDYILQTYPKNGNIIEMAIKEDRDNSTQLILFYYLSVACIGISILTFAVSFFIKK
ncbi:hypothetical protein ACM46_17305 [Chryseobacterium angstadtii]|uniref:Uncharacterized protein n=1 Tax=Chryseobacterium angstadtii TaxID=558151 RepID=A0A0J7KRZ8_9FLAO|nr:hypothetical protein [Chryseobacterium angstadtii]KMQ60010.1 hypothetical protein ACM46_17305 [Chryseobacterium angstadtii]